MASDGDLFRTRQVFGFCKAFNVAVAGSPVEEEAAAILAAAQRALRGEYRVGALCKMVTAAVRTLAEHKEGLFAATDPRVCEQTVGVHLDAIERLYADQTATHETRRVVEGLVREYLLDGEKVEAAVFHAQCRARLGRWLLDRLHFKPTEMLVRKALGLSRETMSARQDAVFGFCEAQLGQWLDQAQANASGRLPPPAPAPRTCSRSTAGLEEALV